MTSLHQKDYEKIAKGVLDDVRVIDLSRLFAGNVLTQTLADFGADVIKVEPPTGDTLRNWKTEYIETHWKIYSRNKKSLCLNLRDRRAINIVLKLIENAQILVESFRPGVLENMGLAPENLHKINPALIIVRISGWGQTGPYSQRPGFGTLIEGISGFASMNGFEDREPVLPPMYLADGIAGLTGASATLIALRNVEHNHGKGQVIDLPLLDPLFTILGPHAAHYQLTGKVKKRTGSRSSNSAPRNVYRCKDGKYVCLSGSVQKMAERLFTAIGRPDMITSPKFSTNAARLKNVEELDKIIGDFIGQHDLNDNLAFFEKHQITVGPIYDISQIVEDEHFISREIIAEYPDKDMKTIPMHGIAARLTETPGSIATPAPTLGADNEAVLATIGIDKQGFKTLVQDGIVIAGDGNKLEK